MKVVSYTRTTTCKPGDDIPSDIIKQQNDRIQEFCKSHGWKITHKYSDRKWDSEEETEFRELLEDGMKRKFDLVVIDSVYRAGSYIGSAREVLCKTLHFSGVSFAVVEDDFVSSGMSNEEVLSYFESKYQEYYRLNKASHAMDRLTEGVFTKGEVKYGYTVTDGKLVINDETSTIVRRIFDEFLVGKSVKAIATDLNNDGILTPSQYRGLDFKVDGWNNSSVRKILKNSAYTGRVNRRYEGVEVQCECPVIISKDIFDIVQKKLCSNKAVGDVSHKSIYSGFVRDVNPKIKYTYKVLEDGTRVYGAHPCSDIAKKYVPYEVVENCVWDFIRNIKAVAERIGALINSQGEEYFNKLKDEAAKDTRRTALHLADMEKEKMALFSEYGDESSEYQAFMKVLLEERIKVENDFQSFYKKLNEARKAFSLNNPWLVYYQKLEIPSELNPANVKQFVNKILFDKCEFDSVLAHEQEWYEFLPEEWRIG